MALSKESLQAYYEQFGDETDGIRDACGNIDLGGFEESTGTIMLSRPTDGQLFVPPEGETDKEFAERLKRSKEAGRNLFYEEWVPFSYEEDADY